MGQPQCEGSVSLARELGVYPPAVCRHLSSAQCWGCLKGKYPGGFGESYIGHSASQAEACSQLASAFIVFVSLNNAFYNSVLSSTCFYFKDFFKKPAVVIGVQLDCLSWDSQGE